MSQKLLPSMKQKRNSVLIIANNYIEDKALEEALKTPFDTVMEILHNVLNFLKKTNKNLANDINIIRSQKLYKYQALDENYSNENQNPEIQNIIGYLRQYSKKNKFTVQRKSFQTSKFNEIPKEMKNKFHLNAHSQKNKKDINNNNNFSESESNDNEKVFEDFISNDEDNFHHIANLNVISKIK